MPGRACQGSSRRCLHRTAAVCRPDTREGPCPFVEVPDLDVRAAGDTSLLEGGEGRSPFVRRGSPGSLEYGDPRTACRHGVDRDEKGRGRSASRPVPLPCDAYARAWPDGGAIRCRLTQLPEDGRSGAFF